MENKTFVYDKPSIGADDLKVPPNIRATLKVISGAEQGRTFPLSMSTTVIGRGEQADVRIDDDAMSRRHTEASYRNLEFRVRDLDSSNGTFLNGSEVKEYALRNGDKIMAGETLFLFSVDRVGAPPKPA